MLVYIWTVSTGFNLHFVDDVAVITSQDSENQPLFNRFGSIWCKWADMIVRVDKCSTFGIKKVASKSVQYLPKLIINNILVPFEMTNQSHKLELSTAIEEMMSDIDQKPLHPKNKLLIYNRYVFSKYPGILQ